MGASAPFGPGDLSDDRRRTQCGSWTSGGPGRERWSHRPLAIRAGLDATAPVRDRQPRPDASGNGFNPAPRQSMILTRVSALGLLDRRNESRRAAVFGGNRRCGSRACPTGNLAEYPRRYPTSKPSRAGRLQLPRIVHRGTSSSPCGKIYFDCCSISIRHPLAASRCRGSRSERRASCHA